MEVIDARLVALERYSVLDDQGRWVKAEYQGVLSQVYYVFAHPFEDYNIHVSADELEDRVKSIYSS